MTASVPVTVVVPARNEAADIGDCLAALAAQTYRSFDVVVVVDVGSIDGTLEQARKAMAELGLRGRVVLEGAGSTPANLNRGLAEATGEILVRVDARSIVPPEYVATCADVLSERREVAVVGGRQVAMARSRAATDVGIARALNNRWGMGLAKYRRGATSGPADTVYLGAFRVEDLRSVGGWNTEFATNQDFELNRRMAAIGAIWFVSELEVRYRPRQSLRALASQYHRFGRWKVRFWRAAGERPRPRQLLLLGLPIVALGGVAAVLFAPRRLRRRAVVAGSAAMAAFELSGPTEPLGGPLVHFWSLVASFIVAGAWTSGVWTELVRSRPSGGQ